MDCSHLIDHVKVVSDQFGEGINTTKNFDCSECGEKEQNWLCLQCAAVNCGRYVKGHAKQHAEDHNHQLCISCDMYSVYCYKCDDYVSNDTDNQMIENVRQCLMKLRGNEPESLGQLEENSKDSSEGRNSPQSNTSSLPVDGSAGEGPRIEGSACEVNSSAPTDSGDSESLKDGKTVEEPSRNLRPRSRKRSHSRDSGSTENLVTSPKMKDKKNSSLNGKLQREKKVVGLKNLGNTCFMNAVLQSLSNIQEFSCYFSTLPALETKTNGKRVYHSRSYTRQEMDDVVMAEELRKVLINLNTAGCGSKSASAISPECLFLVIWKVVPRFRGYQQQDAHEFLRYMLDRLHTELLQLLPQESKDGGLVTSSPRSPSASSIVTAVFGGTLQSEVRCLACGTESKKFDPFLDLSLELPETARHDAPVALADCLSSFVQVEELADTERYYCSSCKCKQKSTKQFWIRRLPNVLCLHLKRFRWNNYFRTKIDTGITFPVRSLDMSGFVLGGGGGGGDSRRSSRPSAPHLYDLAAVIVHHGSGAGSGHYTAFAINEGQWFHFNDQTVRATDAATVSGCKPYILFYIRRELNLSPQVTS